MTISINIDPIAPLTREEAVEYQLHYDKIMEEIASFDDYFERLGRARADVERLIGERLSELRAIELKYAVEKTAIGGEIEDLKVQAKQLAHHDSAARSRIAALKSIKQDFPKEPKTATPSAL